jgi:hypothetical protein
MTKMVNLLLIKMEIEVDYYKKLYKSTNPDNDKLKKYIELFHRLSNLVCSLNLC